MRILIVGSSGFVGSYLRTYFENRGEEVYVLNRNPTKEDKKAFSWEEDGSFSPLCMESIDILINLAGETIFSLWTKKERQKILQSRVQTTQKLMEAIKKARKKPSLFLSASALGYYGNTKQEVTEKSSAGRGFLSQVCKQWEQEAMEAEKLQIRTALLRFGVILGEGGYLKRVLPWSRLGLHPILGKGNQLIHWIAIEDVARMIYFIIHRDTLKGPINLCTPYPIEQKKAAKVLCKHLQRPCFLKVPACLLKASLGNLAKELLLIDQKVRPQQLVEKGFIFYFPYWEDAVKRYIRI